MMIVAYGVILAVALQSIPSQAVGANRRDKSYSHSQPLRRLVDKRVQVSNDP